MIDATDSSTVRSRKAFLGRINRALNLPGRHRLGSIRLYTPEEDVGGVANAWTLLVRINHPGFEEMVFCTSPEQDPADQPENRLLNLADQMAENITRSLGKDRAPWVLTAYLDNGQVEFLEGVVQPYVCPGMEEATPAKAFTGSPGHAKIFPNVAEARQVRELMGSPRLKVEPLSAF